MAVNKKEERQKKKAERQQKKDVKLEKQVTTEAADFGVDLDSPVAPGPMGAGKKAEIDKRVQDYAEDYQVEGLKKFQQLHDAPGSTAPGQLDKERLKRSLRREKRAKFGDVLTSLGRGFQGKSVDPSKFMSSKIRKERQDLYEQYKGASQASRKSDAVWKAKYLDEQLKYLNSKLRDPAMSELEKQQIEKLKAQTEKAKVETEWKRKQPYYKPTASTAKAKPIYTHQTPEGNWNITNQKNPYSDLYYKLSGNSPVVVNELAKLAGHATDDTGSLKRNLSASEVERFSNSLLSKAFDMKVDEQGNQVAIPKPGKENFMEDLSSYIDSSNQLKAEVQRLNEEREAEIYKVDNFMGIGETADKDAINNKYDELVAKAESKLSESESGLKSLLSGKSTGRKTKKQTEAPEVKTGFMDIVNEFK